MKVSWIQVLGLVVGTISMVTVVYVNLILPRMETKEVKEAVLPQPVYTQTSFQTLRPKRAPSENEIKRAIDVVTGLYETERVTVIGEPIVVSLHAPETEQLVFTYEVVGENTYISALEVLALSSSPLQSIFHREGEDFQYHVVSVSEGDEEKVYLLLEEQTGAAGNYLHLSFLEYDGFGKMKEFYALQDLYAALLYPLQNKLVLERDHAYFEIVKDGAFVRLVDHDIRGRLGFHVLTFGFLNDAWYVKHNEEKMLLQTDKLVLMLGEEVFLVRDAVGGEPSVRMLVDGPSLEYVKGPPVRILAVREGKGSIHFLSNADNTPDYALPVQVVSRERR